ncbi:MAG: acid phosphatase [Fluviibacter sp.]
MTFKPKLLLTPVAAAILLLSGCGSGDSNNNSAQATTEQLKANIDTIVVIYAENRSFDTLYGKFPGADGIANALKDPALYTQLDRDGSVLPELPEVWNRSKSVDGQWDWIKGLPNKPFEITADKVGGDPLSIAGPDLVHRFYNNQMQINGGKNNKFAAYSDAGGLAMGHYDGSSMKMWKMAQQYTLADKFFQGTFGGSFQNHQYLVCLCTPRWVEDANFPSSRISILDAIISAVTGVPTLELKSMESTLVAPPSYAADRNISPLLDGKYYAINTSQPAFQPSATPPPITDRKSVEWLVASAAGDPTAKNQAATVPMPPLTEATIGDRLSEKGVSWKWYSGGWNEALNNYATIYSDPYAFQTHHQPFNYYNRFTPKTELGTKERSDHLKDYEDLLADVKVGKLPQVVFYKPAGVDTQHAGYATIRQGDEHIADLIQKLQASPQWGKMAIIVTYDENGGFYDHVKPPNGDYWGPGTRIPAIIISPFAKKGFVDSTEYDIGSIHQFISRRFGLELLAGVRKTFGDLTNAFGF